MGYDLHGNRSWVLDSGENTDYVYDQLDRLVSTDSDTREDWWAQYDPYTGHRTRIDAGFATSSRFETWSHDLAGRLVSHAWDWPGKDAATISVQYDDADRVTLVNDAVSGLTKSIAYTLAGRQSIVQTTDTDGTTTATHSYDADSRPIRIDSVLPDQATLTSVFNWDTAGRLVYARRGDHVRNYTWDDEPTDWDVATSVWRSPEDASERSVRLDFDHEGRLRTIESLDGAAGELMLVADMRWAAINHPTTLEAEELVAPDTYATRKMAVDVGGYYAELGQTGDITRLTSPVAGADDGRLVQRQSIGRSVIWPPRVLRPGLVARAVEPDVEETGAPTQLWRTLEAISRLTGEERRSDISLATLDRPTRSQSVFFDEWLDEAVMADSVLPVERVTQFEGTKRVERGGATASPTVTDGAEPCPFWFCVREGETAGARAVTCPPTPYEVEIGQGPGPGCPKWFIDSRFFQGGTPECFYEFSVPESSLYNSNPRGTEMAFGVELANGAFVESVTDLSGYDPAGSIEFTRTYRHRIAVNGALGHKWFHNYEEFLDIAHDHHEDLGDPECGYIVRWIQPGIGHIDFPWDPDEEDWILPEDALYRIRKQPAPYNGYEIRGPDGTVREFDSAGRLVKIRTLKNTLTLDYVDNKLNSVTSSTSPNALIFSYYGPGTGTREGKLQYAATGGQVVEYDYTACGELEVVWGEPLDLGYDVAGTSLSATPIRPATRYVYQNPNTADCDHASIGFHLLTEIRVDQYDPLTGALGPDTQLINVYTETTAVGGNGFANGTIAQQCLGTTTCGSGAAIRYEYTVDPYAPWGTAVHYTTVHDDRISGARVSTRYEFLNGLVQRLVEDYGTGRLNRTTQNTYDLRDLLIKTVRPDGSCAEYDYTAVAGVFQVSSVREKEVANCGFWGPGSTDLVTSYTYEDVTGQVRTMTTPVYMLTFDYDINQTSAAYPPDLVQYLSDWNIASQPEKLGGSINDCPHNDDQQWVGALVRVRHGQTVLAKGCTQPNGRPKQDWTVDGTTTDYLYYGSGGWDWRGGPPSGTSTGLGPLAIKRQTANADAPNPNPDNWTTPLETLYAWSNRALLIAQQSPTGVRTEYRLAADGKILEEIACAPPVETTQCARADSSHNVLSTSRSSFDLRRRHLRRAVHDAADSMVSSEWMTYDKFDRMITHTVDPDPAISPGLPGGGGGHLHLLSRAFYDGRDRLIMNVTPQGRTVCNTYSALNDLLQTRRYTRLYGENQVCPQTHAQDVVESFAHDPMGRVYKRTDPRLTNWYQWYDGFGRPRFSADGRPATADTVFPSNAAPPASWYEETRYDNLGQKKSVRFYGSDGRSPTPGIGILRATWFEYDEFGMPKKKREAVTAGMIPNLEDPPVGDPAVLIATTELVYGSDRKPHYKIGPMPRQIEFIYDGHGRLVRTVLPPPSAGAAQDYTEKVHTAAGLIDYERSVSHGYVERTTTTRFAYDPWARASETRIVDDSAGGAGDDVTTITYDALGRPTFVVKRWQEWGIGANCDANDRVLWNEYDKAGRLLRSKRRLTGTAGPCNQGTWAATDYTYDKDGLKRTLRDPNGNETEWVYAFLDGQETLPGLGRLQKSLYPAPPGGGPRETVAITSYDGAGNPLVVEQRHPDGSALLRITNQYHARGWITSRVASIVNTSPPAEFFGTEQQEFSYDDLGRMVRARDLTPALGSSAEIATEFSWDSVGRLLKEDQQLPLIDILGSHLESHLLDFSYDLDGFRRSVTWPRNAAGQNDPGRYRVEFTPDDLGRLQLIEAPISPTDPAPAESRVLDEISGYSYLGNLPWQRWHANDTEQQFFEGDPQNPTSLFSLFDGAGRIMGVRTVVTGGPDDGSVKAEFRYGYDRLGHRISEQRLHEPKIDPPGTYRTRAIGYDLLDRVTSWREGFLGQNPIAPTVTDPPAQVPTPGDGESWTLDPTGNWTAHAPDLTLPADTYTPNQLNQYSELRIDGDPGQSKALTFDWLGQLRSDERRQQRYVWDAFGRLTKVLDWAGNPIVTYRFDALNRRVEKVVSPSRALYDEGVVRYIYDGLRMIEERAVLGTSTQTEQVRARFGFGNGLDEVLWMDRASVVDTLGELDPGGSANPTIDRRYFIHQDALGSAVAVSSFRPTPQGAVPTFERFTYSGYGEVTTWSDTWIPSSGAYQDAFPDHLSITGLPFLFTGQRYDAETGLYYYKNRVYDPKLGRFMSRDPLGYSDGAGLYQYAAGAPLQNRDSMGLATEKQLADQYMFIDLKPFNACGRNVLCMSGVDRVAEPATASIYVTWAVGSLETAQAKAKKGAGKDGGDTAGPSDPTAPTSSKTTDELRDLVKRATETIIKSMPRQLRRWFKEAYGIDVTEALQTGKIPEISIETVSEFNKRTGLTPECGEDRAGCYHQEGENNFIIVNPDVNTARNVALVLVHELAHWASRISGRNPEIWPDTLQGLEAFAKRKFGDYAKDVLDYWFKHHENYIGFREVFMFTSGQQVRP